MRWPLINDSSDEEQDVWRDQEGRRDQDLEDQIERRYLEMNLIREHQVIKRTIWTQDIEMSKETLMSHE